MKLKKYRWALSSAAGPQYFGAPGRANPAPRLFTVRCAASGIIGARRARSFGGRVKRACARAQNRGLLPVVLNRTADRYQKNTVSNHGISQLIEKSHRLFRNLRTKLFCWRTIVSQQRLQRARPIIGVWRIAVNRSRLCCLFCEIIMSAGVEIFVPIEGAISTTLGNRRGHYCRSPVTVFELPKPFSSTKPSKKQRKGGYYIILKRGCQNARPNRTPQPPSPWPSGNFFRLGLGFVLWV